MDSNPPLFYEYKKDRLIEITFRVENESKIFPHFSNYMIFLTSQESSFFFIKPNLMNIYEKTLCINTLYPLVLDGQEIISLINENSHLKFAHYKFAENSLAKKLDEQNEKKLRTINLQDKLSEVDKSEVRHKKAKI